MPRFYITTAIDYVNSRPHLGTAYEKIAATMEGLCLGDYEVKCTRMASAGMAWEAVREWGERH